MPLIISTHLWRAWLARTCPCLTPPTLKNWPCRMSMKSWPLQKEFSMSKKPHSHEGHGHDHDDHGHEHHHHDHSHEPHPHQLQPPHEVFHDANAGEIARAWITNGHLSLSLHSMAFGKADIW